MSHMTRRSIIIMASVIVAQYVILTSRDMWVVLCIAVIAYGIGLRYRSMRTILRRTRFFVILGLGICVFHIIDGTTRGLGDKIAVASLTALKLATISQVVDDVTVMISPSHVASLLEWLPSTARLLITMTFSFIPQLAREYTSIRIAQSSRGAHTGGLLHVRTIRAIMIPLLHRLFLRSGALALSLVARGA